MMPQTSGGGVMVSKPIVGQWYLAATCKACNCKILLFPDLNNGQGNLSGSFALVCPQCKCQGSFDAEHYQHSETIKPDSCMGTI